MCGAFCNNSFANHQTHMPQRRSLSPHMPPHLWVDASTSYRKWLDVPSISFICMLLVTKIAGPEIGNTLVDIAFVFSAFLLTLHRHSPPSSSGASSVYSSKDPSSGWCVTARRGAIIGSVRGQKCLDHFS